MVSDEPWGIARRLWYRAVVWATTLYARDSCPNSRWRIFPENVVYSEFPGFLWKFNPFENFCMLFTSTPLCITRTCPSWPLELKGKKDIRWLYLQSFVFSPVLQHRPLVQCAWKVVCGAISGSVNLLYDRIVDKCHENRVVVHCTSRCDMAFDIVQRRRVPCLDN